MVTKTKRSKARKTLTPEERQARVDALHAKITAQVEQLRGSDEWARFLSYARSFHSYSLNNLMLILAQRENATQVAGYVKWRERGRQVRDGEKAINIFGFSQKRITETDENGEESTRVIPRFPILSVFDISQTDPIPGHPGVPENPVRQLTGDDDFGIVDDLTAHMTAQGWQVIREQLREGFNGYASGERQTIALNAAIAPAQAAKTMIHEVAHVTLGHTDDQADYVAHRGTREVEAESTAYIVAGALGLDTGSYSTGYIAGWAEKADADVMRETASRVLAAAQKIIEVLTPAAADHDLAA